jgi:tetratricopeptide (TPR) repeat protein
MSSLSSKKNELFGGSSVAAAAKKPVARGASASASASASGAARASASAARRPQHLKDAAEAKKMAEAYMTKTWKKWKTDPFSAASYYDKAGRAYRAAGEEADAAEMYHEAGSCHRDSNNPALAAKCFKEAATIFSKLGRTEQAVEEHKEASNAWLAGGEEGKAGEALAKAAQELESVDENAAAEMHLLAASTLVPDEAGVGDDFIKIVGAKDVFENALRFMVEGSRFEDALTIAKRYSTFLDSEGSSHSLFKLFLTTALIHLVMDDCVKADQEYREVHLQSTEYLRSEECALEEKLIGAFKNFDGEELRAAQEDRVLLRLNPYLVRLAKTLKVEGGLLGDDHEEESIAAAEAPRAGGLGGVKERLQAMGMGVEEAPQLPAALIRAGEAADTASASPPQLPSKEAEEEEEEEEEQEAGGEDLDEIIRRAQAEIQGGLPRQPSPPPPEEQEDEDEDEVDLT